MIHGSEATGKSSVTKQLLVQLSQNNKTAESRTTALVHATVDVARCISGRHFFESIIVAVTNALRTWNGSGDGEVLSQRCETLAQLAASLGVIFDEPQLKDGLTQFILVLDGMDKQRDPLPTLMPALARLCETVSQTSFVVSKEANKRTSVNKKLVDSVPHMCFHRYNSTSRVSSSLSNFIPLFSAIYKV